MQYNRCLQALLRLRLSALVVYGSAAAFKYFVYLFDSSIARSQRQSRSNSPLGRDTRLSPKDTLVRVLARQILRTSGCWYDIHSCVAGLA